MQTTFDKEFLCIQKAKLATPMKMAEDKPSVFFMDCKMKI